MSQETDQGPEPIKDLTFTDAILKTGWNRPVIVALFMLSVIVLYPGSESGGSRGYLEGVLQRLGGLYSSTTLLIIAISVVSERLMSILARLAGVQEAWQ